MIFKPYNLEAFAKGEPKQYTLAAFENFKRVAMEGYGNDLPVRPSNNLPRPKEKLPGADPFVLGFDP